MPVSYNLAMERVSVELDLNGRILIPASIRKIARIEPGDRIFIESDEEGNLSMMTQKQGIRRAQELVAQYVGPDVSLVEELLATRREDLRRELERPAE